jgi:hypothetical protein
VAFVSFTGSVVAKTRARPRRKSDPEGIIERIEQQCREIASEMQCPCHYKNARVYVDGESPDHLEIEIICCCDKFAAEVREALRNPIDQRWPVGSD